MNNRPMRGGFYTVDQGLRDPIGRHAQAAEDRRVANAKTKASRRGEELGHSVERGLRENPGMLQTALEYLQQDTAQSMAARGAIVGTPITASGAGLISLMQFLQGGREQQVEREGVLPS